jgi:hypothetical protein
MSSPDTVNILDVPHVFDKITKLEPLLQNSLQETILLVKNHIRISKKRNKQNVIYPIERPPP